MNPVIATVAPLQCAVAGREGVMALLTGERGSHMPQAWVAAGSTAGQGTKRSASFVSCECSASRKSNGCSLLSG